MTRFENELAKIFVYYSRNGAIEETEAVKIAKEVSSKLSEYYEADKTNTESELYNKAQSLSQDMQAWECILKNSRAILQDGAGENANCNLTALDIIKATVMKEITRRLDLIAMDFDHKIGY